MSSVVKGSGPESDGEDNVTAPSNSGQGDRHEVTSFSMEDLDVRVPTVGHWDYLKGTPEKKGP